MLAARAEAAARAGGAAQAFLQAAHGVVRERVRPVYTLRDLQPASRTLARGVGSCSQRLACLEAVARAHGVPTRVTGLWVAGAFWYPRFAAVTRPFVPERILLAWPSFWVGAWLPVDEVFGSTRDLATRDPAGFPNDGETLFEALAATPVDFDGKTRDCGVACDPRADLSRFVVARTRPYASRDDLFRDHPLLERAWRGRVFEAMWGGRKSV